MKTIKVIILTSLFVLCMTGCNSNTIASTDDSSIGFYTDTKTCVQYVIYADGYGGGVTIRINQDGTPMLDSECLKERGTSNE